MKWFNAASDLLGLIGAILLALPFVLGQPARDTLAVLEDPSPVSPPAQKALDTAAGTTRGDVRKRASTEYAYGIWGAGLVALSFLLKLIAVVHEAG